MASGMETPRFVHLHLHTDYSLLDGACDLEEVVDEAARREMPAVAVTDHGNLFAAESFYQKAKTRGVKPIIGCEVYVAKGSRHDRGESSQREAENGRTDSPAEPGNRGTNHLVLLCENSEGYRNLIKLVSAGYLEGFYYKQRIDCVVRVLARLGYRKSGGGAPRSGARSRVPLARYFRQREFFPGDSGPGPGNRKARQS